MARVTPCEACGLSKCPFACDEEPCWGEIQPIEHRQWEAKGHIGQSFDHGCEGHRLPGMYLPEMD